MKLNISEEKFSDLAVDLKLLLLDVDGVMTDGKLIMRGDGEDIKAFDVKDGLGIAFARRAGLKIGIITGRTSQTVERRVEELGIDILYQGRSEKTQAFEEILDELDITAQEVAYMGDDVLDMPVLSRVGLSVAPADAHNYVLGRVDLVTAKPGGHGAVRELIDRLLDLRGQKLEIYESY